HAQDKSWPEVGVPTLILGGEGDTIAPVASHAIPFHDSLTAAPEKAYLELDGGGHLFGLFESDAQAIPMIAWLKRHVDGDTRYTQFLCDGDTPAFTEGSTYSDVRMTCPM
ncbi:alpha/beta hydrolase family protein, partial [Actinomadura adrarensis]